MGDVDGVRAGPSGAGWRTEVAPFTRWAQEATAELTRVVAELRAIQTPVVRPAAAPIPSAVSPPMTTDTIAPMVETLRAAAMARLDAEANAARAESDATVAVAMERATALLRSVGADRRTIERATGTTLELEHPYRPAHLRPEPATGEIDPWEEMEARLGQPEPNLDLLGPVVDVHDPVEVYAAFWGDDSAERPVRERVRRWMKAQAS